MNSRRLVPILRIAWGGLTLCAIIATLIDTASRGPVNPLNFFGYFTIQSNALTGVVALIAGAWGLAIGRRSRPAPDTQRGPTARTPHGPMLDVLSGPAAGRAQPRWLVVLRSLATACMVIVGLVYALLLAPLGAAGGVPLPWANWVMHVGGPVLVLVDWIFVRDRPALPWRIAVVQLAYPLVWTAVVLVRGATDGWVPYPFLDPARGYGAVAVAVVGIAATFSVVSAGVVWWSRVSRQRERKQR